MLVTTNQLVVIDDVLSVDGLLTSWKNGNKSEVIARLKTDHPGLTAMFINVGCTERRLTISDVNNLTCQMMDDRVELMKKSES